MNENLVLASENTTTLTDGRVVVMRELTGLDEYVIEKFMAKDGAKPDSFSMVIYVKLLAMSALSSVGDKQYPPVGSPSELIARMAEFKSKDLSKILSLYNTLNGRGDGTDEGNA